VKVAEPAVDAKTAEAAPKTAAKKGGKAEAPKVAEATKTTEPAKTADAAPADAGKKAVKKTSERKQSTKEEPAKEAPKPETKAEEPVKIHASAGAKKINILAISGSLRKESFNTSLLRAAQKAVSSNVEITIFDISHLPFFNQDTEYEPNPAVASFKAAIAGADGILFATPEFNYSMPGVLKNAIDVASRPWGQNSWANKPTGLLSCSVGGFGGIRAQLALRQSALFLKLNIYPGDEFYVSDATGKFDKGSLTDDKTQEKLTAWVGGFTKWVQERS